MNDVTYLPGVDPTKTPANEPREPLEPNEGVVALLEMALERAKRGDIRGLATVDIDPDGYATYSLVGAVGGYSMQGALHCVSAHITDINLGAAMDD